MKNISNILIFATASALLLASCAKDLGGNGSANGADSTPLSFSTSTEGTLDVKGSFATEVTSFTAAGYDSQSEDWFPAQAVNTTATYSDYKWKSGTSYTFYGYANMPSSTDVAEAAIASTGVTLTYKAVPVEASAQNDILLGHYSGNGGGTGTAAMTFYHPLASVVFTVGEIEGISKITSISIKGVYGTGKVGFSVSGSTPAYSWSDCSGSTTVSQTITGNLPAKDAQLGEPFILIPQSFTSPAKIKIQMSATTTAGEDQVIISELTGIALEAGKKTVLAVSYSAQHGLNFTSSLIAWNNTDEQEMDLEVPYTPELLPGIFTVDDAGTKVQFVKGNLYWDGSQFKCEENQYDWPESSSSHFNHFHFSKDATIARTNPYSDPAAAAGDILFAANGGAIKGYTVLSKAQIKYLYDNNRFYYLQDGPEVFNHVNINSKRCIILKPDDWGNKTINQNYTEESWIAAETNGLVALPFTHETFACYTDCDSGDSAGHYEIFADYMGITDINGSVSRNHENRRSSIRLVKIVE